MTFTKCVFCLASGETVKITKEHLFSDWINDVLTPQLVGPNTSYERTSSTSSQPVTWPTPVVANVKARVACEPCNSGWMSDLEGVMKPILTEPVLGNPTQFTPQEQLDIATWACMKAMVFEFAWSEPPAFAQAERDIVRTQRRPPASAQVRVAAIESQGYPLRAFRRGYKLHAQGGGETVCMTMSIGCFVVQVFGGPGTKQHGFQNLGKIGYDFISIYPPIPNRVSWPPAVAMTDSTIDAFAHPLRPLTGD